MTEIFIKYNPYKSESIIKIDGKDISSESKLYSFKNERLQVWIDRLIDYLSEDLNEDEFKIIFQGTSLDFEDLKETCNLYKDIEIQLEHIEAKESKDKIVELSRLIDDMEEGPFEELRDESIRANYKRIVDSQFEIAVIATMSSGKSTLINALLGRELMPTQNEACTAKISRIKNIDGYIGFKGRCLDANRNEVVPFKTLDDEDMINFNADPLISHIDIEGDIPNITSRDMNLVLIDTPGPNNSQDSSHRDHTFSVIKDEKYKPMVLYVLNGTQIGTDDDKSLLSTVAEEMKKGGKQSKDRFIFVVNKIDLFDPDKESIGGMIEKVKKYLECNGIKNPNIYPASSEMAKLIRLDHNGIELTAQQKRLLRNHDLFTEVPDMHLLKYTPLSNTTKNLLNRDIDMFRDQGDTYNEALYHSGIPYIETAINEYIGKYAFTSKITEIVESFKGIIESRQMMQGIEEEISKSEDSRRELHEQMEDLEKIINKGDKSKEFKEKIENLKLDTNKQVRPMRGKIEQKLLEISDRFRNNKVTETEAKVMVDKIKRDIEFLESDIFTDLDKMVNINLKQTVENLLSEYRSYIDGLVSNNKARVFKLNDISLISKSVTTSDIFIEKYKYTQKEKVGEKFVENTNRKWFKPWTWGEAKGYYEDILEDKEYVDVNSLTNDLTSPFRKSLYENIEGYEKYIKEEEKKLIKFFKDEMNNLDKIVLNKVNELKEMSKGTQKLEEKIKIDQKNKEWLDNFVEKLDNILEI